MSQYNRRNPKSYNESYNDYNNQRRNQYSKKYEDSYEEGGYQDDYKGNSYHNNSDYHYKPKGFSNRKAHGHPESETVYVEKNAPTYVDKGRGTQISYKPKKQDSDIKHSEEKISVETSHKQEPHADHHQSHQNAGTTHTEYVPKNQNQGQGAENSHHPQHNRNNGNHGHHHNERRERPPREKKKPADTNKEGGQPKSQQSISSNDAGGVSSKNELDDQNQNKPQKPHKERPPRGERKNKEYIPKPKNPEGHDHNMAVAGAENEGHSHQPQGQNQRRNNNPNKNKDEHGAKAPKDRIKDHLQGTKHRDYQKPRNQKEKPQDGVQPVVEGSNTQQQKQEEGIKPVAVERELPAFDPDDEEAVQEMLRLTSLLFDSAASIPGAEEIPEGATKKGKKLDMLSSEAATKPETVEKRGKKEKPSNNNEEQKSAGLKTDEKRKPAKKNPLHWACAEFNKIYHHKRNFLELYKQLEETWDEIYVTVEDNWETCKCLEKTKPYYFHSFSIYVVIYIHLLIEKEMFEAVTDFYEQQKEMVAKETTFGPIIEDVVFELRNKDSSKGKLGGGFARSNHRGRKQLPDRVGLADFEKKLEDVVIVEKFEKFNNKHLRVEVLEKIKKEEKIAIHFAENPHMEPFISLIQIATKHEVFLLDLQRICKFDDNVKLLVEFFTLTLGKKSSTIIVNDASELCEKLIKSMFIEKEEKDAEFVKLKKELCQALDKNKTNFTDMSKLGLGKNIRELAKNVLEVNMDERERFGNWYRRPLSSEQIALSALDVLVLYASYGKLFESESED